VFRCGRRKRTARIEMTRSPLLNIRNGRSSHRRPLCLSDGDIERYPPVDDARAHVLARATLTTFTALWITSNLTTQWVQSRPQMTA